MADPAPADLSALLLTVLLVAYAHGIVSSRAIEAACRDHVTFIALCGDTAPHFTTIAHFVSTLGEDIAHVFGAVVAICDDQGLISHEMFAIDGVNLPSNASKQRSGTRADIEAHATKLEAMAQTLVERHRAADALPLEPTLAFRRRSGSRASTGMQNRCARGSRPIRRIGAGRRARCGRAIAPTTRVRRWPRARA